jgi:hypothetical protein
MLKQPLLSPKAACITYKLSTAAYYPMAGYYNGKMVFSIGRSGRADT